MDLMHGRTDTELVRAYAGTQDERAFRELVVRHRQMVYRTCLRMLGDSHEAQDATQATFVVLVRKAGALKREGSLTGWLYDVTRKVALEALRRREKRSRRDKEAAMLGKTASQESTSQGALETAMECLDQELSKLSGVLRQAVVLRYLEGHNEREAAVLAGCPIGTMKWRTSEAVSQLRKKMARRGAALTVASLVGLLEAEAHAAVPEALFSSMLVAARSVTSNGSATSVASSNANSLAEGVMKAMFWTKVKVAAAVVLVAVPAAVTVAVAADHYRNKPVDQSKATVQQTQSAKPPAPPPPPDASKVPAKQVHTARQGPVKVDVEVADTKVPLSVMKEGADYFIVCPPCSSRVSCEELAEGKASAKLVVRKGETAFYACCPFCLSEIDRDSARYSKLFDAGLKTAPQQGQ
jgi:RNA polymerase sigma factor (sigma-70 family)